ncbi:MAG: DNA-protecting protein DprA [Pedobacter sp.]|nr:MAG: DNA-protecting protein DprA [Pedobacter sp.]
MSLVYQIALTLIKNIGPKQSKKLLEILGSAEAIFAASKEKLMKVEGIGKKISTAILETDAISRAQKQLDFIKKHQIQTLFYTEESYPRRLRDCEDAPVLLYFKGNINLNQPRIVSVVGTRNATPYGKELVRKLIEALEPYNVLIISGLAYGIDVTAHKESLRIGIATVGVLGHGLDRVYPSMHTNVAKEMIRNGGLITEFLPGSAPEKENFPKRNRIIAGLCDVLVVVEASSKGGALITADIANSYNKDVYAFPGRTNDEYSAGCNFLIKTNRAGLVSAPNDLIYYMGWSRDKLGTETRQIQLPIELSDSERQIIEILKIRTSGIDQISAQLTLSQSKIMMILLSLEMKGLIINLPGSRYELA